MLTLKPRQIFSTTWHLFGFVWFPVVNTMDHNALIMGHEEVLARELLSRIELAHRHLPPEFQLQMDEDTATAKSFPELRSRIDVGTWGVGRKGAGAKLGTTRQRLYGTEIADPRVEDDVILMALQIVSKDGWVAFDSTAKGRRGWFFNECMKALRGDSEFTLFFYPWYQHEEYEDVLSASEIEKFKPADEDEEYLVHARNLRPGQITWKRSKIRELGELSFRELYPQDPNECFLFSGSPCFSQTDLKYFSENDGYCKHHWHGKLVEWPRAIGALERVSTQAV